MSTLFEVKLSVGCPACSKVSFYCYSIHEKMKHAQKAYSALASMCANEDSAGRVELAEVVFDGITRVSTKVIYAYYLNEVLSMYETE